MLTPETYPETIQFRVWNHGTPSERRALIPSELDIALLSHQLTNFRDELVRLDNQPPPPDIAALRNKRDDALRARRDPDKRGDAPELTEAEAVELAGFDAVRHAEYAGWQAAIYRTEKSLEKAMAIIDAPPDAETVVVSRTFLMREFTYEERLDAEDRYTVKTEGGKVEVDLAKRNLDLLKRCVISEQADGQVISMKGGEAGRLPSKIASTLSERLWARAEMSHALADHFRRSG